LGKGSCIGAQVWINDCIRDGKCRIRVGKNVLVGRGAMLSTNSQLDISDFTLIGPNCCFSNADHYFHDINLPILQQGAEGSGPLIVEENCWFGFGAIVPKGVLIGRGSIVGAGAVVLNDIPAFCVAVGCPARIVKFYDFSENRWRMLPPDGDMTVLQRSRDSSPPPSREAYAMTLNANNRMDRIDPCLAGP
jgi:acetyltransferase-like isoleucine patch superfamily enzyme